MYTKLSNYISILRHLASAVAQWVKAFAPQAEGRVFVSRRRKTLIVKTGSDTPTANARHKVKRVSRVLGYDHYKRMPRVRVGVAC